MKKFLLPLMAILVMGVLATSCKKKDYYIESVNTEVGTVTVTNEDWVEFPGNGVNEAPYLQARIDWSVLTQNVLDYGNVNVYVYVNDKQFSLPYVYPVTYTENDGSKVTVAENLKFYLKPERLYLVMQDLDGVLPDGYIDDINIRIVATWPVNYVLPHDDK